jgi:hypothetical protein
LREFIAILVGIVVGLVWLAIWGFALRLFGIPVSRRGLENDARKQARRERIRRMGKLRYVLIFGVFGPGLAFGLALTTADVLDHTSHGWVFAVVKLVFLSVLFGWQVGARTWSEGFCDPVPFPPDFSRQLK